MALSILFCLHGVIGFKLSKIYLLRIIICSRTGNHIIDQLHGEFKIWDGELMVVCGFLWGVEDYSLAKALG